MTPVEATQQSGESTMFEEAEQRGWTGDELLALLKRVGVIIRTINMSGKKMENKCRLCPQARLLKVPCPHEQIWELTK
jgi:hypothetical protein